MEIQEKIGFDVGELECLDALCNGTGTATKAGVSMCAAWPGRKVEIQEEGFRPTKIEAKGRMMEWGIWEYICQRCNALELTCRAYDGRGMGWLVGSQLVRAGMAWGIPRKQPRL